MRTIIDFLQEKKTTNREMDGFIPFKQSGSIVNGKEISSVPYHDLSIEKIAKLVDQIKSLPDLVVNESTSKHVFRFSDSSKIDPCELLATKLSRNVDWVS